MQSDDGCLDVTNMFDLVKLRNRKQVTTYGSVEESQKRTREAPSTAEASQQTSSEEETEVHRAGTSAQSAAKKGRKRKAPRKRAPVRTRKGQALRDGRETVQASGETIVDQESVEPTDDASTVVSPYDERSGGTAGTSNSASMATAAMQGMSPISGSHPYHYGPAAPVAQIQAFNYQPYAQIAATQSVSAFTHPPISAQTLLGQAVPSHGMNQLSPFYNQYALNQFTMPSGSVCYESNFAAIRYPYSTAQMSTLPQSTSALLDPRLQSQMAPYAASNCPVNPGNFYSNALRLTSQPMSERREQQQHLSTVAGVPTNIMTQTQSNIRSAKSSAIVYMSLDKEIMAQIREHLRMSGFGDSKYQLEAVRNPLPRLLSRCGRLTMSEYQKVKLIDIIILHPLIWSGILSIMNMEFNVRMFFVSGSVTSATSAMASVTVTRNRTAIFRVENQIRFNPQIFTEAEDRNPTLMVCLLSELKARNMAKQTRKLEDNVINYFLREVASGVFINNEEFLTVMVMPGHEGMKRLIPQRAKALLDVLTRSELPYLIIGIFPFYRPT